MKVRLQELAFNNSPVLKKKTILFRTSGWSARHWARLPQAFSCQSAIFGLDTI
jgi:hypothetical protein